MRFIISVIKNTLTNFWFYAFWVLAGGIIGIFFGCIYHLIDKEEKEAVEAIVTENVGHCPDNYMVWEVRENMMPIVTNRDGDSILIFEKQIKRGCRPFLTGSETSKQIEELKSDDPVVDSVYYTAITGSVNLTKQKVIVIDTNHWARERPKCREDTSKNDLPNKN